MKLVMNFFDPQKYQAARAERGSEQGITECRNNITPVHGEWNVSFRASASKFDGHLKMQGGFMVDPTRWTVSGCAFAPL